GVLRGNLRVGGNRALYTASRSVASDCVRRALGALPAGSASFCGRLAFAGPGDETGVCAARTAAAYVAYPVAAGRQRRGYPGVAGDSVCSRWTAERFAASGFRPGVAGACGTGSTAGDSSARVCCGRVQFGGGGPVSG